MTIEKTIYQTLRQHKSSIKNALSEVERELGEFLEGTPFWVILLTEKGKCIYANNESIRYAQTQEVFNKDLKDTYPFLQETFEKLVAGQFFVNESIQLPRKKGDTQRIVVRGRRMENLDLSEDIKYLFICADLTEILGMGIPSLAKDREAEAIAHRLCQLIDSFMEGRGGFVATISQGQASIVAKSENIRADSLYAGSTEILEKIATNKVTGIALSFQGDETFSKNTSIWKAPLSDNTMQVLFGIVNIEDNSKQLGEEEIVRTVGEATYMIFERTLEKRQEECFIRKQNMRIQQQQHMLQVAIDSMPLLMVVFNQREEIEVVNKKLEEFCGRKSTELKLLSKRELLRLLHFEKQRRTASDTRKVDVFQVKGIRCLLQDKNSEKYRFLLHKVTFSSGETKFELAIGISNTIEQTNEVLSRTIDTLKNCNYVLSHDLRGPFNNIGNLSGMSGLEVKKIKEELASESYSPGKKLQYIKKHIGAIENLLNRIEENAHDGEELIEAVLDFTRVDKAEEKTWVNAQQAVSTAMGWVEELDESSNTIWIEPLPIVLANKVQLQQIFKNLISNAAKYKHPERPLSLSISCLESRNGWTFHIKDNGIGIPKENQSKIWGIFQCLDTTSHAKKYNIKPKGGSKGVGLAIVKRMVERHGGSVWVESEPGQWTKFTFSLPKQEKMLDA